MAAQKKKAQDEYGAASITILEGLEAVRKRPGMYIGSTGERGLHHLIWEVVDNAVDEAMAGHASTVNVVLLEDGGVEVTDDGRGIPVEMHASGIPTVDVVMTQLHAGGKFDSDAYAISGGLHGVGVSVVNALSSRLEVEISRDGHEWSQVYEKSVPLGLKQGAPTKKTGSTVRFWADPNVFETTEYDFETVARRLQEMAFLNKGLTINLTDERVSQDEVVDVLLLWRWRLVHAHTSAVLLEDPVHAEGMKVHVQIERTSKPLRKRDGAGLRAREVREALGHAGKWSQRVQKNVRIAPVTR